MFCVKGFADGTGAERFFGFAAVVIEAINIAAIDAAKKLAGNSGALQTFGTEELRKAGWIKKTDREHIDAGRHQSALWIKVPLTDLPPAISPGRRFSRRVPRKMSADTHKKPE